MYGIHLRRALVAKSIRRANSRQAAAHVAVPHHLLWSSRATCAGQITSKLRVRLADIFRSKLLLAGPATAVVLFMTVSQQGPSLCNTAALALVPAPEDSAAAVLAHRSHAIVRVRRPWWRVLWRSLLLLLRIAPVFCIAPACWLLRSRGGEGLFWRCLLAALQSHGPITIKFAQWASTRPDLLSSNICDHFAQLQAHVKPHSYGDTVRVVTEAFGVGWDEFLELEDTPLGSGCMAQIHRARLRAVPGQLGQEVAVKVRHPGAQEQVDLDLQIMWALVWTLETLWPSLRYLSMSDALGYFEDFVRPQADLRQEAANLEEFHKNFEYSRTGRGLRVRFPEVIRPYVTESVLVESYEDAMSLQTVLGQHGPAMAESAESNSGGLPVVEIRERVGKLCLDAFLQMAFRDNFIHGDLHPGNVLFCFPKKAGSGAQGQGEPEIVFIDAGLAVRMSPQDRRNFVEVFHAIAVNDGAQAGRLIVERSPGDPGAVIDKAGFVKNVEKLVNEVQSHGLSLGSIRLGGIFADLLGLALAHRVKLETSFVKVVTSIIVFEGVGQQLNPVTDLILAAKPLLVEAFSQRLW